MALAVAIQFFIVGGVILVLSLAIRRDQRRKPVDQDSASDGAAPSAFVTPPNTFGDCHHGHHHSGGHGGGHGQ